MAKGSVIEPLDKSVISEARKRAEEKARELLGKELSALIKPRNEKIAEITAANEKLRAELDANQVEIDRLNDELSTILDTPKEKKTRKSSEGGTRVRRSDDELKEVAEAYARALVKAGQSGLSASELAEHGKIKAGMSIPEFIKTYAGKEPEKTGDKRSTRYYMSK